MSDARPRGLGQLGNVGVMGAELAALARASWLPERPDRTMRAALALMATGPTLAGGIAAAAARYPDGVALVDDDGELTYRELWAASDALGRGLRELDVGPGTGVGILARNGRVFTIALLAASRLGADVVFLNTGFAGPQLAAVVAAEGVDVLVRDDEFAAVGRACAVRAVVGTRDIDTLIERPPLGPLRPSRHQGTMVILTSGTTGRPRGARRGGSAGGPSSLGGAGALLSVVPIRARTTVVIAAPTFHAWGMAHLGLALGLSSTAVVAAHFDAEATLRAIAEHRAEGLVVVPVMLQRMMALSRNVLARHDISSLRYIVSSGAPIRGALATAVLDHFGPILYNVYGSTEVSLASIARPQDLLAAPTTAGRVVPGATVRVLDDRGRPVERGAIGRVFVASGSRFDGYTDGRTKEAVDGLLSSGDLGHFDDAERLHIDGREDDMIVSGGENVYPIEVEDVIAAHPSVLEVAVVGVPDDEFGQRLKAVVVRRDGAKLTATQVRTLVRDRLARHEVPRDVVFVKALPRTATGKIRRVELR